MESEDSLKPPGHGMRRSSRIFNFRKYSRRSSWYNAVTTYFRRPSQVPSILLSKFAEREGVPLIRERILEIIENDRDSFDPIDEENLKNSDEMIVRFLLDVCEDNRNLTRNDQEQVLNTVIANLTSTLKWRKDNQVNHLSLTDVPQEFLENLTHVYVAEDKRLYIMMKSRFHIRSEALSDIITKLMLIFFEKNIQKYAEVHKRGIFELHPVIIQDVRKCGVGQLDWTLLMKLVDMIPHYPGVFKDYYFVGVPWWANSALKLLLRAMPRHISDKVKVASVKDLTAELGEENLPSSLGGSFIPPPIEIPVGQPSLREVGELRGVPDKEIRRWENHFKDVKEWEEANL